MAGHGEAPSWVASPVVPLTPAETWSNWNEEVNPAVRRPGWPTPAPRDPATINPREPALADALLLALRHISRLEGELVMARASLAGQAAGQALAEAIEHDRPAPVNVVPPEGPGPAPAGETAAVQAAVQSGSLVALALARQNHSEGRRVRARRDEA